MDASWVWMMDFHPYIIKKWWFTRYDPNRNFWPWNHLTMNSQVKVKVGRDALTPWRVIHETDIFLPIIYLKSTKKKMSCHPGADCYLVGGRNNPDWRGAWIMVYFLLKCDMPCFKKRNHPFCIILIFCISCSIPFCSNEHEDYNMKTEKS